MYLQQFGLREEPFGVTPDPRFLYLGSSHREALASLLHGIQTGRAFVALIAGPGMGKTTLLGNVLQQTQSYVRSILLFQTQCTRLELLRYMLADAGLTPMTDDVVGMHNQFNEMLISNDRAGRKFVVVIDEAQNLSDEVLESVRLLSDFETPQRKLLQIILAGQPQLGQTLSRPGQAQLRQRISIISRLKPLSVKEVQEYIQTRLAVAGRTAPLFTKDAVEAVALRSGGIPRVINNYCFNLLSLASAMGRKTVEEDLVDEATLDLELNQEVNAACPQSPPPPVVSPQALAESFRVLREYRSSEQTPAIGYRSSATAGSVAPIRTQPRSNEFSVEPVAQKPAAVAHTSISQQTEPSPADRWKASLTRIPNRIASYDRNAEPTSRTNEWGRQRRPYIKQPSATEPERKRISIQTWSVVIFAGCIAIGAASLGFVKISPSRLVERVRASDSQRQSDANASQTQLATLSVSAPTLTATEPIATHDNAVIPNNHTLHNRSTQAPETGTEKWFVSNGSVHVAKLADMPAPKVTINSGAAEGLVTLSTTDLPKLTPKSSVANVVPGTLIRKVMPKYPATAPRWLTGDVELTATVMEDGKIGEVSVEKGSSGILSQAAVAAVREWRYTPFTINGKPVRATTHVIIKFKR